MDKLLQPDTGLIIWTFVTFGLLFVVLAKAAWKPILDALEKREGQIRENIEKARASQEEAEALRRKYEAQMAETQRQVQDMVSKARSDAEKSRAEALAAAKAEAERVLEKGRRDLAGETDKLRQELRQEVAGLSVAIAEKIVRRSVDAQAQADILNEALGSVKDGRG